MDFTVNAVLLPARDYVSGEAKLLGERQVSASDLFAVLEARGWLSYFQHVQAAQFGVAGYWWLANPNLAAVLDGGAGVMRHWIPSLTVEIEQAASVTVRFKHPESKASVFAALLFWLLVRQAQGSRVKMREINVSPSFRDADYIPVFSEHCVYTNAAGQVQIEFSLAVFNAPFVTANATLLPLFSDNLPFTRSDSHSELSVKIYHLMDAASDLSEVSPGWVAAKLAVSERTLNRQLAELNTTFRELLTRFRNGQAIAKLCEGESIDRLADYLGFSERAAFERAFKSWQGVTPAKFQAQYRRLSKDVDVEALISPDSLPNIPAIGAQLLALAQRDDSSLEDMAGLVEQDPVLAAKLISIASSAFYGMKPSSSIKDIVVRVFGVDKLRSLALAVLAAGSFRLNNCPAFSLERFWILSLGVAQLANDFYREMGKTTEVQADIYLAGLLHNIGRLVLIQCFPHKMQALLEPLQKHPAPQELLAMEKLRLGVDTSEAGALLLARWQLPRAVSLIMRQLAVDKVAMIPEAHLLLIAEEFLLANIQAIENSLELPIIQPFCADLSQLLRLPDTAVEKILLGFLERLPQLRAAAELING